MIHRPARLNYNYSNFLIYQNKEQIRQKGIFSLEIKKFIQEKAGRVHPSTVQ